MRTSSKRRILSLLSTVLLIVGVSVASAGPAAAANVVVYMYSQNSQLCADDPGGVATSGQQLDQWACASQPNLLWEHVPAKTINGANYYLLKNGASHLCMNVKGASYTSGASIIQWRCDSSATNELWHPVMVNTYTGAQHWVNYRSGMCLNVAGNSYNNGAWLIQYPCGNYGNEAWINTGG